MRVSDWLVFHQLLIQSSKHSWHERKTDQGKTAIDTKYGKEDNVLFFSVFICKKTS